MKKLLARVEFDESVRARWPSTATTIIVEARPESEPWSVRLELWSPPDESGLCVAWVSVLNEKAPIEAGQPTRLTLGGALIGELTLAHSLETGLAAPGLVVERDFLDIEDHGPVRKAA